MLDGAFALLFFGWLCCADPIATGLGKPFYYWCFVPQAETCEIVIRAKRRAEMSCA